jgi:adenylate cyclase
MGGVSHSNDSVSRNISRESTTAVRFAGLVFDLDACTLVRASGEAIALTRGELGLLRLFVSRPGRALSRETILDAVADRPLEPFDRSVDVLVARLRRKIEPDPKAPILIITIPGEGYRFDGLKARSSPVAPLNDERKNEISSVATPGSAAPPLVASSETAVVSAPATARTRAATSGRLVIGGIVAIALLAAGAHGWRPGDFLRPAKPAAEDRMAAAPRLSIVVLPFQNLSGVPEQEYFADGLTDDLTSDLSHLSGSFVIGRGTAFTYKGKPLDAKRIGRELGVRYVLEGSVRPLADRIVVNAGLVSTETGAQLWADRFDGERTRLGELQVEFVSRLANSVGVELVKAEALRATQGRADSADASDLAMRGWALANATDSKERFNEAINLFERAVTLDPNNVEAMTGLASVLIWRAYDGWSDNWDGDMARAEQIVNRALMMRPDSSMLHNAYANLLGNKRQWQAAIAENETAIAYDRNNALAYAVVGLHKAYAGRGEEGIADLETALRLSPHDGDVPNWQYFICHINNLLGRWERAIEWCTKSVAGNPELTDPLFSLAVAHAWAGHDEEARDAVARIQKAIPGFTMRKAWPAEKFSNDPSFKAQYARLLEGLRKAGVPEGDAGSR